MILLHPWVNFYQTKLSGSDIPIINIEKEEEMSLHFNGMRIEMPWDCEGQCIQQIESVFILGNANELPCEECELTANSLSAHIETNGKLILRTFTL